MNKNLIINILYLTVVFLGIISVSFGQVKVGKVSFNAFHGGYHIDQSVSVYTQKDIDKKLKVLSDSINKISVSNVNNAKQIKALDQKLDSGLTRVEESLNELIKSSIDKLPHRLLTDEAKKILKAELKKEIISEIEVVKNDLQKQIDQLK